MKLAQRAPRRLAELAFVSLLPGAHHYAEVREELRRRGRPIPENDIWIAALAREHAQPVVTRDEHFDQVVGVQRVGW